VFAYGDRVVRATLYGRVVTDNQHFTSRDASDPGDETGRRGLVVVHLEGGQRRQFQKWGACVEQQLDAFANGELPLFAMPLQIALAPTLPGLVHTPAQLGHEVAHSGVVLLKFGAVRADSRLEAVHEGRGRL
jgi:hypothetical protein